MPVEDAVIEAPQVDAAPEANGETVDTTQVADGEGQDAPEIKGDDRVLKQAWRELKTTHPDLVKDYKNNFFGLRALKEEIGDLNVGELKAWLAENGGRESIEQSRAELTAKSEELDGLYASINEGKTDLIQRIPDEALPAMATAAWERYRDANPEGWSQYQAGVFANTLQSAGIPNFLNNIQMMLRYNDVENLPGTIKQLQDWVSSFSQQQQAPQPGAQRQQSAPAKQDQGKQQWQQEKETWERERYAETVGTQAQQARDVEMNRQLSSFFDRRKGDNEAQDAARSLLNQRVNERLTKDAEFQKKVKAFDDKRDSAGALRLIQSKERALIEELAPGVGRSIFGQPAATRQESAPAARRAAPAAVPGAVIDPKKALFAEIASR